MLFLNIDFSLYGKASKSIHELELRFYCYSWVAREFPSYKIHDYVSIYLYKLNTLAIEVIS